MLSPRQLKRFQAQVQLWYSAHQRILPWRATQDPYRIWLSEIMLQQTTVAAVIPYFDRFLAAFPDVETLAAAEESEVLRNWEGLGYYSRARNIHRAAQVIVGQYQGEFPADVESLRSLPGVGRYTAGAIASFAFGLPAPIVEANTQRLYARLLGLEEELTRSASQKALWNLAEQLVPLDRPGDFNQALMDLGSRVCKPVSPSCEECPVQEYCQAFQSGRQHEIPRLKAKQPPTPLVHVCVAGSSQGKFLLRQYQPGERWGGLWDFPRWEWNTFAAELFPVVRKADKIKLAGRGLFGQDDDQAESLKSVEENFQSQFGAVATGCEHLTTIKHTVTRYSITLVCFEAELKANKSGGKRADGFSEEENFAWVTTEDLSNYPLSTTARKIADLLQKKRQKQG